MSERLPRAKTVVGAKQALKALQSGKGRAVYMAKDADNHVTEPVVEECRQLGITIVEIASKRELGQLCSISVGAAVAVVVE